MYLVFTHMPGESYCRQLKSLLMCLCDVFRALINSHVYYHWGKIKSASQHQDDNWQASCQSYLEGSAECPHWRFTDTCIVRSASGEDAEGSMGRTMTSSNSQTSCDWPECHFWIQHSLILWWLPLYLTGTLTSCTSWIHNACNDNNNRHNHDLNNNNNNNKNNMKKKIGWRISNTQRRWATIITFVRH